MKFKHLLFSAGVLISGTVCAENLIHNGDFQLGNSGFSIERWQRPDTNPEMIFHPLVTEDDPRSPGRKILKIDNSYKEQCFVYACEMPLEAEKTYYLRGEIRSSGSKIPAEFSMIYLNRKAGRNAQGGTIVAEKKWKRFEFPVRTQKFGGMYHLKITLDQPSEPGMVYLSGLSLSSESDTAFHGVEIGFRTASRVFFAGERGKCTATVRNAGGKVWEKTLKLVAADDYSGVRRTILERPLRLVPGGVEEIAFDLPADRFGSFRIEPEDSSIRFFPGYYAVIGKVKPLRFDPKRYSFGVNNTAQLKWRKGKAPGYVASNASVREELHLLSLAGCRLIRAFTGMGIDWMLLEPEPGKFNYLYLDTTLKLYEEAGIAPLAVLCSNEFIVENYPWSQQIYPDWLLKGAPYAKLEKSTRDWRGYNCPERNYVFPDRAVLERYIRAIVSHAGKRVMQYEISNEPGCAISPEQYMDIIFRPVTAVLRKENPEATIVGVCSTSDKGYQLGEFLKACLELNVAENSDAISFHPYGSPELSSPDPADKQILTMKEMISKYKAGMPIWNTELFYLFSGYEFGDFYGAMQIKAHHAAARYLVELSLGVAQSTPLESMQIWRELMIPNYQHITSWPDSLPGPVYSVYNALTRFFEGAEAVSHRNSPDGLYRCAFRKDGKLVGAIWDYRKRGNLKLDLTGFEVYDLFGNPLPGGVMTMTAAPVYLKQGALSEAEFLKKLDSVSAILEQTLSISTQARLIERNGKTVLLLGLRSCGMKDESGYVGVAGKGIAALEPVAFTLKRGEYAALEVPVKVSGKVAEAEVRVISNGKIWKFPVGLHACRSVQYDGAFRFRSADGVLSASAELSQKPGKSLLKVRVNDTTDSGEPGKRAMWEQDCVELFIDAAPRALPGEHADAYQPSTFRLFIMPRFEKGKQLVFWGDRSFISPDSIGCHVTADSSGYEILLELPEKAFGKESGLEIKINDAPGTSGNVRSFSLFDAPDVQKNRLMFTIVENNPK